MSNSSKLIPLIVAAPLFLQNVDLLATTVALPDMAVSLQVQTLHLNLVIAAYAISLAVFLPLSAWLVDRFGAKRIFTAAIVVFSGASALCGLADTATVLIACRILQGFGAAMMVPVGRLILLRSIPAAEQLSAMAWYTVPPAIGRLMGPLIGGLVIYFASWRWIFLINIPLGIVALVLALKFLDDDQGEATSPRFDVLGFGLLGIGLGCILAGLEIIGRGLVTHSASIALVTVGVSSLLLYGWHNLRIADPVIDFRILRYKTFRINVIGSAPMRMAHNAVPFLIPLMLQISFGMSALGAGIMVAGSAAGSVATRLVIQRSLRRFRFRRVLLVANLIGALILALSGMLTPNLPYWLMWMTYFLGGLAASMCFVSLNTFSYIDVPRTNASHATALVAMAQQTFSAAGVVLAAALLGLVSRFHGGDGIRLALTDFKVVFLVLALLALFSLIPFWHLNADDGKQYMKDKAPG